MRRLVVVLATLALMGAALPAAGQESELPQAPDRLADLQLDRPIETQSSIAKLDRVLRGASGRVTVSIRLKEKAAAEVAGQGAQAQRGQVQRVEAQQTAVQGKLLQADPAAEVLATTKKSLNAIFATVDAAALPAIAADPAVLSVKLVRDYELALEETVPYIGATDVHGTGVDGSGVVVAVLDTGVDYTHAALGGPGTVEAYFQAYGENRFSGKNRSIHDRYLGQLLFPTDKVIGGYDFVGERWPDGPLRADPDPIDFDGHGTHVADIIGGVLGVAPGADIFAIKVCSSVSTSCSGVALIQAMDLAVDPNGDNDTSDHVDIINMSLGSIYGTAFDDDLSQAVENATTAGVLTVAAAGNASDKPYVADTPGNAPSALSVAQTQVPSAGLQLISVEGIAEDIPAVFQPWSVRPTEVISGPIQYGDGAGGNLLGCNPFAGSLDGLIVLVDRGECNFTLKIKNISDAGGEAGIIGLVAPGEPFAGGDGGDRPINIPGYMISLANANAIRGVLGNTATIDPANVIPLVGQIVGSSARGPSMGTNIVKPEIGAPGASVSAEVGTGTGTTPFSGTSGATPMVAGSAALLLDAYPERTPLEVKAVLVNTGEIDIDTDPFTPLTPISRIGGGEVRADRAVDAGAAAWDADSLLPTLSFGFVDAWETTTQLTKTVKVRNYTGAPITYNVTPEFRYANDEALGAVAVSAPASIEVPANGDASFEVTLTINGASLNNWTMNSGSRGADPAFLTEMEFDGYLQLSSGNADDIHVPWHVLPRKSSNVAVSEDETTLTNDGVRDADVEAYTLFGVSPDIPEAEPGAQMPIIDLQYVGINTFGISTEICEAGFLFVFAVNTHERQTHANAPASFEFDLDFDGDGTADYAIFNADLSITGPSFDLSDGRNVVLVENIATGDASVFFFVDHETNSANTVLLACGEQFGLTADDLGNPVGVTVLAVDIYFQGTVTDSIEDIVWVPGLERYLGVVGGAPVFGSVPAGGSATLQVVDFGDAGGTDFGVLLMYRGGAPEDNEAAAVTVD